MPKTLVASKPKTDFLPGAAFDRKKLLWIWACALVLALVVYQRALHGAFVFDDQNLPFMRPDAATMVFRAWVGVRPLLMSTYYANYLLSGLDTLPYHLLNVFLHSCSAILVLLAVNRVLEMSGVTAQKRRWLSIFSAAIFLLHPVQTESVAYVASRSEDLSVLFFLAAYCVFLYRREAVVSWRTAATVLLLYGAAMSCKEHTAVLPGVLLLTDYFWNSGYSMIGVRRNWRLYLPMLAGGAFGLVLVFGYIARDFSIGFHIKAFTWYQYLFTQFRAFFVYLRLFIFPYGQKVDYNFPISHNLLEHGAAFFGLALVGLVLLAVKYRKRFPLCAYGLFVTLLLLAPTSSIMPINDPLAERRLYLPFIGLLLILCGSLIEWRGFWRNQATIIVTVCLVLSIATYERSAVWENMVTLWSDVVKKSPENPRAQMGLGSAYALSRNYEAAIPYFQRSAAMTQDYASYFNLGMAYESVKQPAQSVVAFRRALEIRSKGEAWAHVGVVDAEMGQIQDALDALDRAEKENPDYALTYTVRGTVYLSMRQFDSALTQFQRALAIEPGSENAKRGIYRAVHQEAQF